MHSPGATPWVRRHRAHHDERMYVHVQGGCGRDGMSVGSLWGGGEALTLTQEKVSQLQIPRQSGENGH